MGKPKYDPPTNKFPFAIPKRLNLMSVPRKHIVDTGEGMPAFTPRGIRKSALQSQITNRVHDISWPYTRRILSMKRMFKHRFNEERLDRLDRIIEASNGTMYSKLANCVIDLKNQDTKDVKKKKGWSESEWKKHMDYIITIAQPKQDLMKIPPRTGQRKPLDELMPRIHQMCSIPKFKVYKRLSKEEWYRDPIKVSPKALQYVISDRVKKLAAPRVIQQPD